MLKTCKKEYIKTFFKNLYSYIVKLVSELVSYFGFLRMKKSHRYMLEKNLIIFYYIWCILYYVSLDIFA